jgi:hypothetical protein
MVDITIITRLLTFVPSFNLGEIIFLLISALITTLIIYAWMKVFHEPPHPAHAFGVALVANLQNLYIPFLVSLALPFLAGFLPAQVIILLIPLFVWILLLKVFYPALDIKHVIVIAVLSYGTHTLLQGFNLPGIIQAMLPI